MNMQAEKLADRLKAFHAEVTRLVKAARDVQWGTVSEAEQWPFGVVARHVAAGHYRIMALAEMITKGQPLPKVSMDQIVAQGNDHARKHADCTRDEVLALLKRNGDELVEFVEKLTDGELAQKAHLPLLGRAVNAAELIDIIVLQSGGGHLTSLKTVLEG
jgi:hypothetical protein